MENTIILHEYKNYWQDKVRLLISSWLFQEVSYQYWMDNLLKWGPVKTTTKMSPTTSKLKVLLSTATKSELNMFTHIKYMYTYSKQCSSWNCHRTVVLQQVASFWFSSVLFYSSCSNCSFLSRKHAENHLLCGWTWCTSLYSQVKQMWFFSFVILHIIANSSFVQNLLLIIVRLSFVR